MEKACCQRLGPQGSGCSQLHYSFPSPQADPHSLPDLLLPAAALWDSVALTVLFRGLVPSACWSLVQG